MASRKFKTYCRIIDYVDSIDSELAEIVRGTCADIPLGSTKGKPGITFLMPQDKAYRKKIADLAYSAKVEDANKASDMLNALIIRDVFKSPSDWLAKKDDIPNSLLPSQHVEIDNVSGKEVVFKSGARAVLDTDFQDASRKSNLAVWKLTGEIPVTTDKPAKHKYAKMARAKVGSYDPGHIQAQNDRFKIAIAVENAYVLHELARRTDRGHPREDVYLRYTLSLIHFILHIRKDDELLLNRIIPLLGFDHLDFYLLVEPHRFGAQYLLPDELIRDWWLNKTMQFSMKKTIEQIENLLVRGNGALVYTGRTAIIDKLAEIRQNLCSRVDARPRSCVEEIAREYAQLEQHNTIGGLGPIYPTHLATYYANEPGLKMLHDELRYLTYGAFKRLEEQPTFDMGYFHELTNMIGDYLHAATAEERERVVQLLNKQSIKFQIAPTEKIQEIKIFINSTIFMHIPLTQTEAEGIRQKYTITRPNPNNIVLYNIQKDIYVQHARLLSSSPGAAPNKNIMEVLESLDINTLDPELKKRIAAKLGL